MKILHTADWHLGNTFHGHSRHEEHEHFLAWLLETLKEQQPDVMLLAGDIFDSPNPSAAAENLFYKFLHDATTAVSGLQVIVCAGNHDSGGRIEAPQALLYSHNIYVRGTLRRTEEDEPDYAEHVIPVSLKTSSEAVAVVFALPYLRSGDYATGMSQEEGLKECFKQMERELALIHNGDTSVRPVEAVREKAKRNENQGVITGQRDNGITPENGNGNGNEISEQGTKTEGENSDIAGLSDYDIEAELDAVRYLAVKETDAIIARGGHTASKKLAELMRREAALRAARPDFPVKTT